MSVFKLRRVLSINIGTALTVNGQNNSLESRFFYYSDQKQHFNNHAYGGGVELITNIGEYIKRLQ